MRLQIDQWAARYFAPDPILGMKYILPQRTTLSYVIPPANRHIRTRIELNIDPSDSAGEMQIILNVFARYGAILSMSFYPQEEEENNG